MQEIVDFEQSRQNVEEGFQYKATCFFWVGSNHSPGLDREQWKDAFPQLAFLGMHDQNFARG